MIGNTKTKDWIYALVVDGVAHFQMSNGSEPRVLENTPHNPPNTHTHTHRDIDARTHSYTIKGMYTLRQA